MSSVSVIIPCYNRAPFIAATINNFLNQSAPPKELIVVDDGSTDNSVNIIKSFGSKVKLICQSNQGPGAARNAGYRVSSGEFIQFMDSDDLASNNKLETQKLKLLQTGADFAYCPWVRCSIENNRLFFLDNILQMGPVPPPKSMLEWSLSGWSLVFQNCLFRRSILEKSGPYRTDLMPSEDSELFVRVLLNGARAVHTPECLVFYREHTLNKITSTGTSAVHRALDWTRYLNVIGEAVKELVPGMRLSTRIAITARFYAHQAACSKLQVESCPDTHPFYSLSIPFKPLIIKAFAYYEKVLRRLKGSSDFLDAFQSSQTTNKHIELVRAIGYQFKSDEDNKA